MCVCVCARACVRAYVRVPACLPACLSVCLCARVCVCARRPTPDGIRFPCPSLALVLILFAFSVDSLTDLGIDVPRERQPSVSASTTPLESRETIGLTFGAI